MGRRKRQEGAELSRLVRVSHPVEACGRTYDFTPLSLADIARIEAWARQQPFVHLRQKLEPMFDGDSSIPRDVLDPMIAEMTRQAQEESTTLGISEALNSLSGLNYACLVGFRTKHPEMTQEDLDAIIDDVGLQFLEHLVERTSFLNEEEQGKVKGEME